MKHIEKLIRYSLPEPDQHLSYGGVLSTGTWTFLSTILKVLYAESTLKYAYLDALVMMVTDESLCWCFHSLAASCASWQRRPPRWVSSPGLRPRDPRPAAERRRASARCPSSLRPLSRSAAAAATSAYTLTKLLRKSESGLRTCQFVCITANLMIW